MLDRGERNHNQEGPWEAINRINVLQHRDDLDCLAQTLLFKGGREGGEGGGRKWRMGSGSGLSVKKKKGGGGMTANTGEKKKKRNKDKPITPVTPMHRTPKKTQLNP